MLPNAIFHVNGNTDVGFVVNTACCLVYEEVFHLVYTPMAGAQNIGDGSLSSISTSYVAFSASA